MGALFKEGFSFSGYERDLLAMGTGDGRFVDISGVSGVDSISDGRGAVFADLDNDGDLDIFLTTAQRDAHYLFRNNVGQDSAFLRVELEGRAAGRDAFGAVVRVKSSAGIQTKLKAGGSGYVSHHDGRLLFGLGADREAEWVEVRWPGGAVERLERVPARSAIRIVEGTGVWEPVVESRFRLVDPLAPEQAFIARLGFRKGQRFPDIELRAASGQRVRLHELLRPGRGVVVNFWATWCAPCAREMPELERLREPLGRAGIDLIGVSLDLETRPNVAAYLEALRITYPVYTTDEQTLERLYPDGQATVPLTVVLDGRGQVLEVHSGWSERSRRALRRLVGRLGDSGGAG